MYPKPNIAKYASLKNDNVSIKQIYTQMMLDHCLYDWTLRALRTFFLINLEDALKVTQEVDAELFKPYHLMKEQGESWQSVYDHIKQSYDAPTALRITCKLYPVTIEDVKRRSLNSTES